MNSLVDKNKSENSNNCSIDKDEENLYLKSFLKKKKKKRKKKIKKRKKCDKISIALKIQ